MRLLSVKVMAGVVEAERAELHLELASENELTEQFEGVHPICPEAVSESPVSPGITR